MSLVIVNINLVVVRPRGANVFNPSNLLTSTDVCLAWDSFGRQSDVQSIIRPYYQPWLGSNFSHKSWRSTCRNELE